MKRQREHPRRLARTAARIFVLLALVAGTSGVTAGTASADVLLSCPQSWSDKSWFTGTISGTNVNYRTGPHTSCTAYGQWSNVSITHHCWATGDFVNGSSQWWHVQRVGTSQQGWVHESYVSVTSSTSTMRC
ncbi:hypothetical protein [Polymorphospora sp. NPDC050346]|uniref:hypothetical protein n=1 Tax=Polymorphospora sp. NPDC050346 TaxID=3155780 RepID=UPI0034053838